MPTEANDKIVREWAERNGMEGFLIGDLRTALDDARSIPELAALQAQQPDRQDHALLKCAHDQLATRLAACEAALEERDARLMAQQPGAQAVTDELIDEAVNCAWHVAGTTLHSREDIKAAVKAIYPMFVGTFIRTPAQPPSIPEPSEADVEAIVDVLVHDEGFSFFDNEEAEFRELFRRALTIDRARLRERIGGGG